VQVPEAFETKQTTNNKQQTTNNKHQNIKTSKHQTLDF